MRHPAFGGFHADSGLDADLQVFDILLCDTLGLVEGLLDLQVGLPVEVHGLYIGYAVVIGGGTPAEGLQGNSDPSPP